MAIETRHLNVSIARPASEVYEYVLDPAHLAQWAPGLGSSVEQVDGRWFVRMADDRVEFAFVDRNDLGVLDHRVTTPSGETFLNPMRVIPDGDGCDVVFTVRRAPGVTDDEFARDLGLVSADLDRLGSILEGRG